MLIGHSACAIFVFRCIKQPHFAHCLDIDIKLGHFSQIEYLLDASASEAYSVLLRKKSNGVERLAFLPVLSRNSILQLHLG